MIRYALLAAAAAALACAAIPAAAQTDPNTPDIPAKFDFPTASYDYVKRTVMIPMRDGARLYTVIVMSKGAHDAPILISRTPYNARKRAMRFNSPNIVDTLSQLDEPFVADGYIRVYQDVRGKFGSEGDYVATRPLVGPLNRTRVDHSTDAWDTIDWLVKNLPQSNGRVGIIGSSYDGFTSLMASSPAGSRSMTAIRRPTCPTSSSPSPPTTERRPSGSFTPPPRLAPSNCQLSTCAEPSAAG